MDIAVVTGNILHIAFYTLCVLSLWMILSLVIALFINGCVFNLINSWRVRSNQKKYFQAIQSQQQAVNEAFQEAVLKQAQVLKDEEHLQ